MSCGIALLHLVESAAPTTVPLDPRSIAMEGSLGLLVEEAAGLFLPEMSPRGLLFGVTVQPELRTSQEGQRLRRLFRLILLSASVPAAVTLWAAVVWRSALVMEAAFLFPCAFAYLAFIVCRAKARPLGSAPNLVRKASLAGTREGLPGGALHLVPGLLAAASFVHLAVHWDELPDPYPIRFDLSGHPLEWAHKSLATVYGGPLVCTLAWILVIPLALSMVHASRGGARNSSLSRRRRLMAGMYAGAADMAALIGALMAVNPFLSSSENRLLGPLFIAVVIIALILFVVVLVRYFRAGPEESGAAAGGDGTPDGAWKAGMFYCSWEDPALWVPARFGLGYTLNFGNRWAWPIVFAMCLFAALVFTVIILSGG